MNTFPVKKGDEVVVIAGSEKGRTGKVLEVLRKKERAIIEGLALRKHHVKKSAEHPNGAIVEREGSIHVSNLMLKERYALSKRKKLAAAS